MPRTSPEAVRFAACTGVIEQPLWLVIGVVVLAVVAVVADGGRA